MIATPLGRPIFEVTAHAQVQKAPIGNGFFINDDDLRFIFKQIQVSQANAAGGALLGPGPNQVNSQADPNGNPQLPMGLRTVDGSYNNLVPIPDQHMFGAADLVFPRKTTPVFRDAEPLPFESGWYRSPGSGTAHLIQAEDRIRLRFTAAPDQQPDRRSVREQPCGRRRGSKPVRIGRLSSALAPLRPIRIPARCSFRTSRRISASPRRST
jgi:hypothetical protein